MKVVRRRDNNGVELIELEQVFDVREHVRDIESIGKRSRFRSPGSKGAAVTTNAGCSTRADARCPARTCGFVNQRAK